MITCRKPWSAALLSLAVAVGCSKVEKEPEPVVSVQVARVGQASIARIVRSEALIFPLQQAAITPKISAPVKRFYVNRGSPVKSGQLLATLENSDLAASAIESKGALAQAQAAYVTSTVSGLPEEFRKAEFDVETAKQALDAEQKSFDSRHDLYQQGALPRKDLDQARVTLSQAKSQYELAQQHWNALQGGVKEQSLKSANGQLQSAEGKYQGAEAQLAYSQIRSPIEGVVTDRAVGLGEMASVGTPLLVVMNTSSVIAKAHIPQADAALLKVGNAAELTVQGSDEKIPARVSVVSPATDVNSTTIEVWAEAKNPESLLKPGTTVELSITAQQINDAVVVPAAAVVKQPDGSSAVMVAGSDGRAHLQVVQAGIQNGDSLQIVSGLKAGQQIVTSGAYGIPDNTQIKVEAAEKPPAAKSD
jgi:HlyD family secretion protein